jgi:Family of unknown function (DUF5715)
VSDERDRGLGPQGGEGVDDAPRTSAADVHEAWTPRRHEEGAKTTNGPRRRALALIAILSCTGAAAVLVYVWRGGPLPKQVERVRDAIANKVARPPNPYAEAVSKIEEDRGEATGRKAEVEVPQELKQYAEPRRFLAVQEAAAREAGLEASHDFAALAASLKTGGLVEAPKLGRGFVLYGVGLAATGELTHYDAARGRSVPLFADDAALKSYREGLEAERTRLEGEWKELADRLRALDKKDRQGRTQTGAEQAAKRREIAGVADGLKSLADYYGTAKARDSLYREHATLAALALDFGGRTYDLSDAASVKEFQARLLCFVRPAALAVMEELGSAYQEKFGRPLPITSLIRTEEYQRTLREAGNANAGDFKSEPHTTGLAFDVYYRFMDAAEQQFVMDAIARLKRDGSVEALRELRDHYHVFAFPEGRRPPETLIEEALKGRGSNAAGEDEDDSKSMDSKSKNRARR